MQSGANLSGFSNNNVNFGMNLNGAKIPGPTSISATCRCWARRISISTRMLTCDPSSGLGTNQFINPSCFAIPEQRSARMARPSSRQSTDRLSSTPIWDSSRTSCSRSRRKLQFRFNGYNFLNHPLWSFNGSNLNLGFDAATGKVNTPLFGTVTQKQGHRIVQAAIKFYF